MGAGDGVQVVNVVLAFIRSRQLASLGPAPSDSGAWTNACAAAAAGGGAATSSSSGVVIASTAAIWRIDRMF